MHRQRDRRERPPTRQTVEDTVTPERLVPHDEQWVTAHPGRVVVRDNTTGLLGYIHHPGEPVGDTHTPVLLDHTHPAST